MERVEAEAQHLGTGGEHTRPPAHRKLRTRGGVEASRPKARAGALPGRARPQRLRGATPAARQAQGGGAVQGVGQDRRNYHHESSGEEARHHKVEWLSNAARDPSSAACSATRRGRGARLPRRGSCSTANWPETSPSLAGGS